MIVVIAPVLLMSFIGDWGNEISISGYVLRTALFIFPIMRIICEFVFFTYVVKNSYITIVMAFLAFCIGSLLMGMTCGSSAILGITNMSLLYDFPVWSTYSVVHPETVYSVYDTTLAVSDIVATIVVSLVTGAVFLILGGIYYEKDDLS